MKVLAPLVLLSLLAAELSGQAGDLAAIYAPSDGEELRHLVFKDGAVGYEMIDTWTARRYDLADSHPHLSLSGDFNGNGVDELAIFNDLIYTPNMNPAFTTSIVTVLRSHGERFVPSGSWFSVPEEQLDLDVVSFSVAGDFTMDGLDDIALFYNDHSSDELIIYLLESSGSGFSVLEPWHIENRDEFNFTALKFASSGDFNGNGKPDIAVFYNYFGTAPGTKQAIFLFESDGSSFTLLPAAFETTKADFDFSNMKYAFSGDYNQDGYSDIAVVLDDSLNDQLIVSVFEGSSSGQFAPTEYIRIPDAETDVAFIMHAASGAFSGDSATDLAFFYDNQATGNQDILLLENTGASFQTPEEAFSTDKATLSIEDIIAVHSGSYIHSPTVSVATWKDDRKGSASFTFDDGYRGAFMHGGAELESAGLKGTFYIFSDSAANYFGELASTNLVRSYKDMGHEIGSHTSNHANLGFLTESGDLDSMEQVLSSSVDLLNERFDQQTISMSIPFGSFRQETLNYISQHFYSARSSQFGFNLATPYDFHALRSWPIVSSTSPGFVETLLYKAEAFGTYIPLMYHDILDEAFDEDSLIYTYSRDLFRETLELAASRDLWIDTHARIYKYISQRNSFKVYNVESGGPEADPRYFSFEADDGLEDSIFNVELTLKIRVPEEWAEDSVSVGFEEAYSFAAVQQDESGGYILYDWNPADGGMIRVMEGKYHPTGIKNRLGQANDVYLSAMPNPFQNECIISLSGRSNIDRQLIIRDIHGRVVREARPWLGNSYRFLRQNLTAGIYIVQVLEPGRKSTSIKIIAR